MLKIALLGTAEILINMEGRARHSLMVQDNKAKESKLERDPAEVVGW